MNDEELEFSGQNINDFEWNWYLNKLKKISDFNFQILKKLTCFAYSSTSEFKYKDFKNHLNTFLSGIG